MGQHHWLGEDDLEPDGDPSTGDTAGRDAGLLAAVTGLGGEEQPDGRAVAVASGMDPGEWPDLRGARDLDPQAQNPWRTT